MRTAVLVLASGLSRRFGPEDKLLTELKGQALLAYCLDTARSVAFDHYYVVCPDPDPRADLAQKFGYEVIANPAPHGGQGYSLALGARRALDTNIDKVCILLGDMPFVTTDYLNRLLNFASETDIVFSHIYDRDQPPAIFSGNAIRALTKLSGDQGARVLDLSAYNVAQFDLPKEFAVDFDRPEDFGLD